MSQAALEAFKKARDELMRKQRKCAWCGHVAKTEGGLVRHILENHPDRREDGLTQDETDLLALLQKENAQ